jgi:DNA-directed RNA polymerase subunit RPC12/RpoP
MTIEHRQFIELEDIVALQYECKECHATVIIPREKWGEIIQQNCPHCGIAPSRPTEWVKHNSSEETTLHELQRSIAELVKLSHLPNGMGCHVRLEIKGEENGKGK